MKESVGKQWKREFLAGEEIIPTDLDAPIPDFLKQPTQPSEKIIIKRSQLSRREMLEKTLGAGAGLIAGIAGANLLEHPPKAIDADVASSGKTESRKESVREEIETSKRTIVIPTGKMAGRKVGDLFAYYLGLPPSTDKKPTFVPKRLKVNFAQVLEDLWDKKIARVAKDKAENDLWINNMKKQGREIFFGEYTKKWERGEIDSVTIPQLIQQADAVIADMNASLNWTGLNSVKTKEGPRKDGKKPQEYSPFGALNDRAVSIVKDIASRLTGEMLMAYSITELMPSLTDGDENVDEYELLAKHAGTEFLSGAPALGDPYLSAGPFQFTSFAIYDANGEQRGASMINKLLPQEKKIPGSVSKLLTMEAQFKAAHLFAVHNIALLVKDILDDKDKDRARERLVTFIKNKDHEPALLQYIASAHHAPGNAIPAFKAWLDVGMRGSHSVHAKKDMPAYIKKSYVNLQALKKRHPKKPHLLRK